MSDPAEAQDRLSDLLRRVAFGAQVFFSGEYCGRWAVDTSGSRQVPFHLVSEGEGWLHGESAQPQPLQAGELVLFPGDAPHLLAASPETPDPAHINQGPPAQMHGPTTRLVCGYFEFDRRAAAPLLDSLPAVMVLQVAQAASADARQLAALWMREAAEPGPGSTLAVDRLAELVFVHMLRGEMAAGALSGLLGALADPRLGPALAQIHSAPEQGLSVPKLAALAAMSESAFAARFRDQVGMAPGQYVKHWRIQSAAALLRDSDVSMAEVAQRVGYESEAAFRKAFKAHFDIAPGRWRRSQTQRVDGSGE
ncbi:MAG: AraC family transcriptional regulator [Pseudomonadota bacterium]